MFAITSNKSKDMYSAIWRHLFELIPELRTNIKSVTSDYERAQISSAKENFNTDGENGVRISGCMFHFLQVSCDVIFVNEKYPILTAYSNLRLTLPNCIQTKFLDLIINFIIIIAIFYYIQFFNFESL